MVRFEVPVPTGGVWTSKDDSVSLRESFETPGLRHTLGFSRGAAFVLWQLVQAIFDPAHRRDRWHLKRLAVRLGCLLNAARHGVLVGDAVWRVLGWGAFADNGRAQAHLTTLAMQLPFGRWAVAVVGAGIAAFGVFQFNTAASSSRCACPAFSRAALFSD